MNIPRISETFTIQKYFTRMLMLFVSVLVLYSSQATAAPPENHNIWRAEILISVSDVDDGGTSDNVAVQLNANNSTWIKGDRSDFVRGRGRRWDLRLEGINQIRDIDYLRIAKTGSDGLNIRYIYLLINNQVIYSESFANGLWLDTSGGHTNSYFVDDYFMRQKINWTNYMAGSVPTVIPVGDMRERIETVVGDIVTGNNTPLDWGPIYNTYGVELWTVNANTLHVDLDLGGCPYQDDEVDVDFDLRITCGNARPNITILNLVIATANSCPAVQSNARDFINNLLQPRLKEMLKNYVYYSGRPPFYFLVCPQITISPAGDVHFIPQNGGGTGTIGGLAQSITTDEPMPAEDIPDDTKALLSLQIKAMDAIPFFEETPLTIKVKSNLSEDADADLQIKLPAQIQVADVWLEVLEGTDRRLLLAQIEQEKEGRVLLKWRDHLAAGKEAEYVIRVRFADDSNTEFEVGSQIALQNNSAIAETLSMLRATTLFQRKGERIKSQGTLMNLFPRKTTEWDN